MSDRVQSYIRKGIEEGAEVLVGGEGHPKGLEAGYFVKPTVFVNVSNDMTIAREEIFGPTPIMVFTPPSSGLTYCARGAWPPNCVPAE